MILLGGGTNILVLDGGVRGIVVNLGKGLSRIEIQPADGEREIRTMYAEAGAQLVAVLREAQLAGLGGLEVAAGIQACAALKLQVQLG